MFIAVERCVAICRPLKVRVLFNPRGVFISVFCMWVFSALFSLPLAWFTHTDVEYDMTVCRTYITKASEQAYILTSIILFYVIPFVTSMALYVVIGRQLRLPFIKTCGDNELRSSVSWRQRKLIAFMMFTVSMLFFSCLLPFKIISIWTTFDMTSILRIVGFENFLNYIYVARILYYLNSTTNPVIYSLLSSRFKKHTKTMFCAKTNFSRMSTRQPSKSMTRNTQL